VKVVLASNNAHKVREIRQMLPGVEVVCLLDLPEIPEPPETGDTFEANALEKARFVFVRTGALTIADDSGLEVDALGGRPGVHSKRFSPEGTDAANNALLLRSLPDTAPRTARYRCVIAVVGPGGEATAAGACEGVIGSVERGSGGFGYDPLFWPVDTPGRTMAELTPDEKNRISHRGRAVVSVPAMIERCS
jgi:XTP/dITP diphosphohydrolase